MFEPRRGLVTIDAYLHGLGENLDTIGMGGEIEYVGRDYFILRLGNERTIKIDEENYCLIEEGDFQ